MPVFSANSFGLFGSKWRTVHKYGQSVYYTYISTFEKKIKRGETSLEVKKIDANSKFMFQPANFFWLRARIWASAKSQNVAEKWRLWHLASYTYETLDVWKGKLSLVVKDYYLLCSVHCPELGKQIKKVTNFFNFYTKLPSVLCKIIS